MRNIKIVAATEESSACALRHIQGPNAERETSTKKKMHRRDSRALPAQRIISSRIHAPDPESRSGKVPLARFLWKSDLFFELQGSSG